MLKPAHFGRRITAAVGASCAGLALAGTAAAVDLRDWGRKFNAASDRFVVLSQFNNAAVLDKETQLVWWRSVSSYAVRWDFAITNCLLSGTGGRYGWRLPSFSELSSLAVAGGVLPAGHPFQNVAGAYLWSTTEAASYPDYVYTKTLSSVEANGGVDYSTRDETQPYLCVRGA